MAIKVPVPLFTPLVGHEFWKQLAAEHGIQDDGSKSLDHDPNGARDDIFFYETDNHHFVPRNMMIDLEPRVNHCPFHHPQVINSITSSQFGGIYNSDNIFVPGEGGGAGNNWAHGYSKGTLLQHELLDRIDREADECDNLQVPLWIYIIQAFLFTIRLLEVRAPDWVHFSLNV